MNEITTVKILAIFRDSNCFLIFYRTLTVNGWSATELSLSALRKFTRYEVRVRAFNAVAAGPASAPVSATTLEGGIES